MRTGVYRASLIWAIDSFCPAMKYLEMANKEPAETVARGTPVCTWKKLDKAYSSHPIVFRACKYCTTRLTGEGSQYVAHESMARPKTNPKPPQMQHKTSHVWVGMRMSFHPTSLWQEGLCMKGTPLSNQPIQSWPWSESTILLMHSALVRGACSQSCPHKVFTSAADRLLSWTWTSSHEETSSLSSRLQTPSPVRTRVWACTNFFVFGVKISGSALLSVSALPLLASFAEVPGMLARTSSRIFWISACLRPLDLFRGHVSFPGCTCCWSFSAKKILETFRGTFLLRNPTLHVSFGGGRWCPKPIKSNIALRRHAIRVVRCDDELLDVWRFLSAPNV